MISLTFDAYVKKQGVGGADMPDDMFNSIMDDSVSRKKYALRYEVFLKALELYNALEDKEDGELVWVENPCTECKPDDFLYLSYIHQFKCNKCGRGVS